MALQQAIGPVQGKQRAVRVISWNCNGLRTVLARNGCNSMACLLDRLSRGVAGETPLCTLSSIQIISLSFTSISQCIVPLQTKPKAASKVAL